MEITIREFTLLGPRAIAVLEKLGMDYRSHPDMKLDEACAALEIQASAFVREWKSMPHAGENETQDFASWPLDLLADYIEKKHHRYIETRVPLILQYLNRLIPSYGRQFPELVILAQLVEESGREMGAHMRKEELVLFPYIREQAKKAREERTYDLYPLTGARNPIALMFEEHDHKMEGINRLAELTRGFTPPMDASLLHRLTYALLQEFEEDLHQHLYLEDEVLFKRALEMESRNDAT